MARRISKRSEQKGRKTTSSPAQNEASFVVAEPLKRPSVALVIAVVLTAILEVLDITIVSVSIPHMLGSFGATSDQITWVLTSYLVVAAARARSRSHARLVRLAVHPDLQWNCSLLRSGFLDARLGQPAQYR
jgi:hypothetical protein